MRRPPRPTGLIANRRTDPGHVAVAFAGSELGDWKVERMGAVRGPSLPAASHVRVVFDFPARPPRASWILRGVTSHERYATRAEHDRLVAIQPPLDRPQATRAALIPIAKSAEWWELSQDQRRIIFEDDSHHIAVGLEFLPAIARRLYHCHDLDEPFDFLTWFEYAPADATAFEQLVLRLRASREWEYVEREIDIRLSR